MKKWILSLALFAIFVNTSVGQDSLKVMFYNLLRFPESGLASRVDNFRTIFQYEKPDVILVCELSNETGADLILNQALNVFGITKYQRVQFQPNSTGGDIHNLAFYNSEKVGLVSQDKLSTNRRDIGTYLFYFKDPALAFNQDTVFLDFWSTHLKAGSSESDLEMRRQTSLQFIDYINTSQNYPVRLFSGDFNMRSSNEDAWGNIIDGAEQWFYDPINSPGTWHNNINFSEIHTQSPRTSSFGDGANGGMDDRFDFILISEGIYNEIHRVKYIDNSYRAIGNDGNHYNTYISNGTNNSAPDSVIIAIHDGSDHLPVSLLLEIEPSQITAIEEDMEEVEMRLFPNPSQDEVHISGDFEAGDLVEIWTMSGQLKARKEIFHPSTMFGVDISNLTPAQYLILLRKNRLTQVLKFQKLE